MSLSKLIIYESIIQTTFCQILQTSWTKQGHTRVPSLQSIDEIPKMDPIIAKNILSANLVNFDLTCPNLMPSRHFQDTGKTLSRHLPHNFQKPSRYHSEPFQTPSNYLSNTFQTLSKHLPDTFRTPSRHLPDNNQTKLALLF